MITSALIAECRREFNDQPKSIRVSRAANNSITMFNLGKFPVIEGSYKIFFDTTLKTETTDYTLDLDNGDLFTTSVQANGVMIASQHKYADWRDKNWVEAINDGIQALNGLGFFRQVVREARYLSSGVRSATGPDNAVDIYELVYNPGQSQIVRLGSNWAYQQDANKIVLGNAPSVKLSAFVSYLRNIKTYSATSATLDPKDDWIPLVKKYAGARFLSHMAMKIAKQGTATVDEGHLSTNNLRAVAKDLKEDFRVEALRKKPTRPAKDIQWQQAGGGIV